MNKYETIFLVTSTITEEKSKEIAEKVKQYISSNGNITKYEEFGKRRLAYEIQKQKEAYYYSISFESKAEKIHEIERIYRITDEIIKFMTVKVAD